MPIRAWPEENWPGIMEMYSSEFRSEKEAKRRRMLYLTLGKQQTWGELEWNALLTHLEMKCVKPLPQNELNPDHFRFPVAKTSSQQPEIFFWQGIPAGDVQKSMLWAAQSRFQQVGTPLLLSAHLKSNSTGPLLLSASHEAAQCSWHRKSKGHAQLPVQ